MLNLEDAVARYGIDAWGGGYFGIDDAGCAVAFPHGPDGPSVTLDDVIRELRRRGYRSPYLLRFPQILQHRVRRLHEAFRSALAELGYPREYMGVYPVKVNQQRVVLDALTGESHGHRYGLEVGSKGELLLALAQDLHPEALVICNGFKDRDYLELAVRSRQAGRRTLVICETLQEVRDVLAHASEADVRPELGLRMKLYSRGVGRWQESGGSHAKFGLSTEEVLRALRILQEADSLEVLRCLHFHVGSQISDIVAIKEAVREAARFYCQVRRRAAGLDLLDLGGGLGIDYDGSGTASDWSRNYALEEYCRDCVYYLGSVCQQEGVRPPVLISESGRAVAAQHAVLATSPVKVIGRSEEASVSLPAEPCHQVRALEDVRQEMSMETGRTRECVRDARMLHDEVLESFKLGVVGLEDRAAAEALYAGICRDALATLDHGERPGEAAELEAYLAPFVVCNFSVFQSTPDTWAVRQVFPVMPLSRLRDEDSVPVTIGDITCDSDGCISAFPGRGGETRRTLHLPPPDPDNPYHIGVFLVGAYQDTLGDFHNLLGAPNQAAVWVTGSGRFHLSHLHRGTSVAEAAEAFGHKREDLLSRFEDLHGEDDSPWAERYRDCFLRVLNSNTYLRG